MSTSPDPRRRIVVLVVVALAAVHLVFITAWALPPTTTAQPVKSASGYVNPFFAQGWALFAPSPLSSDHGIRFQGAYRDGTKLRTTPWLDWSAVERDLIRHRVIGGRPGYVGDKLWPAIESARRDLGTAAAVAQSPRLPDDAWSDHLLQRKIVDKDIAPALAQRYAAVDLATVMLATDALAAAHPNRTLVAVRFETSDRPVTPYEQRHDSAAERRRNRPAAVTERSGWRHAQSAGPESARAIADFWRRHR